MILPFLDLDENVHNPISTECYVQKLLPTKLSVESDSLLHARTLLQAAALEPQGVVCPCCDQIAKVYPRAINATMAAVLLILADDYREHGGLCVDVSEVLRNRNVAQRSGGDWARLKYWGLIERQPGRARWRITDLGLEFAAGTLTVERELLVYDDEVVGTSDPTPVCIHDCIGGFDVGDLYQRPTDAGVDYFQMLQDI